MGIVSCVGSQLEDAWRNILEGNSGIAPIDAFDTTGFSTRIAGAVKGFDVSEVLTPKDARKMDPFMHYGIGASNKALADSGLGVSEENGHREAGWCFDHHGFQGAQQRSSSEVQHARAGANRGQ